MKDNAAELLKHFFLEIRDIRKENFGEEYEPATLIAYRRGAKVKISTYQLAMELF